MYFERNWSNFKKWFHMNKGKKRTVVSHGNFNRRRLTLLASTPAHAGSKLHSLEQIARGIGFCANASKTELIYLKQGGDISTLRGKLLKLVDLFLNIACNISSTENNVNIRQVKVWAGIVKWSIIWKSDLFEKIKRDFF